MVATISALTVGQEAYHLGLAREDYYVAGGEPPGYWVGQGVQAMGLGVVVTPAQLKPLFRGWAPDGVTALVRNAGASDRQPGWDITFSAPKSVSALWALAGADVRGRIQRAHDEAVAAALTYLEDQAAFTRRGRGGAIRESVGLCVAAFPHGTSRALDPQLHTHCLVLNIGGRADGSTGTIESQPLYRQKMTAGALYRVTLATRLEEQLGLTCVRERGWFEVAGVPRELIEAFSRRRHEIEAALRERGVDGPRAAAVAALETRSAKRDVSRDELFGRWAIVGQAHGLTAEHIQGLERQPPWRDVGQELAAALCAAVETLTGQHSYFSRAELVRYAAEAAQGRGLDADHILAGTREYLKQELVSLGPVNGEERFTTREMLDLEARLLIQVDSSRTSVRHRASAHSVQAVLTDRPTLTDEQVAALRHVTEREGAIQVVAGMAGTGKSYLLSAAREVWQREGLVVLGAALAGKAAQGLQDGSGIPSTTIHKTLRDIDCGRLVITPRTVIVIDEAGMVGTVQAEQLVRAVVTRGGGKLVLVGDARQLQPIEAGGPFAAIGGRLGQAELTRISRQREEWARKAVRHFAAGDAGTALRAFAERGLLSLLADKDQARRALVADWVRFGGAEQPADHLILAGPNLEVSVLNQLAQAERHRQGLLGAGWIEVGGQQIYTGDRVLFTRNSSPLQVKNGQFGEVLAFDAAERVLSVRLDTGRRVLVALGQYDHIKLAYAVSTHRSQGVTVENAYVFLSESMTDRELAYVQVSRSRNRTRLYTDRTEAGHGLADLTRQMSRSRRKELAHDVASPQRSERPGPQPERRSGVG